MAKMWAGRTSGDTDRIADDFNSSIAFDSRMAQQDIRGSIAHARMLAKQGIIPVEDEQSIIAGLEGIADDILNGRLEIDLSCEDIHMFVEQELTERIGEAGKRLHTARSRNDQVALDLRLYLRDTAAELLELIEKMTMTLTDQALEQKETIMPGYTHLQRAQPIVFGHHLMAYAMMLLRDRDRLTDCLRRMDCSPIGCCALAGTTYRTDRRYEAELLGFHHLCLNSLDGVSDRDYCLELMSDLSILMMHLSRLAEEIILWTSWEFRFVELSDLYTTGSSIMPQKKNSDMAELIRGKTGRVYGDLISLLVTLKGLPLAYNKDMQEDKERVFDACDTARDCLQVFEPMIRTMKVHPENMKTAAEAGFINATDLADYLTGKGLPFRTAYKISGQIVSRCIREHCVLETLPLEEYREYSELIDKGVYDAVNLENCVARRISEGGTAPSSVEVQAQYVRKMLK